MTLLDICNYLENDKKEKKNDDLILLRTINNINIYSIKINNTIRYFLTVNIDKNKCKKNSKVLLGFHGGGEDMYVFLRYTEFNLINEQVIIFNGQTSANIYTYQSTFPYLLVNGSSQYQNDIDFVDTVITKFFKNKLKKIFLTGKSDGAGFCMLLSNLSKYKKIIKAIGICSDAHFGLYDINNIGPYNSNNKFIGLDKTIIPYNIITPPKNISIFLMHGTEDTVMPYDGQEFPGSGNAIDSIKITLWRVIDPEIINLFNLDIIKTQTFTPDIPNYVQNILKYSKINNLFPFKCHDDLLKESLDFVYILLKKSYCVKFCDNV